MRVPCNKKLCQDKWHEILFGTIRQVRNAKKIEIPTAAAIFPAEMSEWPPRSYVERIFNLKQWTEMPEGGHFAALEKPDLLINDIKKFSRSLKV